MQGYNPSVSYAAGTTKARLRKRAQTYNPSVSYAASSPYTGEPNEACADLSGCPYTGGAYRSAQTLFSGTDQRLPCVKGGGPPPAVEGL